MPWKTVNVTARGLRKVQNIQDAEPTSVELVNAAASKYRVNILHNAEKIVGSCPKRKRRASKPAITESSSKKPKRAPIHKEKTDSLEVSQRGFDAKSTSYKRRSTRLQSPGTEDFHRLSTADRLSIQACASDSRCPELLDQSITKDSPTHVVIEQGSVEIPSVRECYNSADALDPPLQVKTSSAPTRQDESVNGTFSDTSSTNFDEFDDSVFDETFQACLGFDSSQPSICSPTTPILAASLGSEKPDVIKPKQFGISPVAAKQPNGSPFLPFMHPCLLDSLTAEALALNKKDASTPSLKHTCFRAAELLRLSKSFMSKSSAQHNDLIAELFATIKAVQYANGQGQGQGLVLADVFFPDKQPFITASSRIPYNARSVIPGSQAKGEIKSVVKATIRVSGPSASFVRRPAQSGLTPIEHFPTAPHTRFSVASSSGFEVTDVRTSS